MWWYCTDVNHYFQEHGLVIVGEDAVSSEAESSEEDSDSESSPSPKKPSTKKPRKALVSVESAQLLDTAGEGSLGMQSSLLLLHTD